MQELVAVSILQVTVGSISVIHSVMVWSEKDLSWHFWQRVLKGSVDQVVAEKIDSQ